MLFKKKFAAIEEALGAVAAVTGGVEPGGAPHGGKVVAKAKVLADEGHTNSISKNTLMLQYQKYIVEVHPEDEPAFRAEVEAWVHWIDRPGKGDELQVLYDHGTQGGVELVIRDDPRFDWNLRGDEKAAQAAAQREELLKGTVPQDPL
jgi:hypothetical protein